MPDVRELMIAAALACSFAVLPSRAQQAAEVRLPDPSEGNVDGLQGVNFVPEVLIDGERRIVDASGCTVHLVPSNVDKPLVYECAKWFAPPPDRYSVWLEQGGRLSHETVLIYPGSKFGNNGMVAIMPLEDAGFAALSAETIISGEQTARFLSLEASPTGFDKRLQAREAKSPTRLPAGKAMAGVFDADGNALALSKPFVMKIGKTVIVTPKPPVGAADLMVVLGKRQATWRDRAKRQTSVSVRVGDTARAPDEMYETDGRIIAVWYGLTGNAATLMVTSDFFRSPEQTISLPADKVTTVREELSRK